MDIKSLYTVIPNDGGLQALSYFLDKTSDPTTSHCYSNSFSRTCSLSKRVQLQQPILPSSRRSGDGKQDGTELCLPFYWLHRGSNFRSTLASYRSSTNAILLILLGLPPAVERIWNLLFILYLTFTGA